MVLRSKFFGGNQRLEACATQDSAHIARGARGEHVTLIQRALNLLENAGLDTDGAYGGGTAGAVLRYKQKRSIINRSYQSQADDIVGKMTIIRLDNDLAATESTAACTLGSPAAGSFAEVSRPFAITGSSNTASESEDRMMQSARARSIISINEALRIFVGLQQAIVRARLPFGSPLTDEEKRNLEIIGRWLNFNPGAPVRALPTLADAAGLMRRNLAVKNSKGLTPSIQRKPGLAAFGEVQGSSAAQIDHGVDCGDSFFNAGPNCHRDVITHEFFHFLGVGHGGGGPQDATPRDRITTPAQALNSADNLAQMIGELTTPSRKTDACARRNE